jgi:hypothetical protein
MALDDQFGCIPINHITPLPPPPLPLASVALNLCHIISWKFQSRSKNREKKRVITDSWVSRESNPRPPEPMNCMIEMMISQKYPTDSSLLKSAPILHVSKDLSAPLAWFVSVELILFLVLMVSV